VVTMENGVFWDVTPCGSCRNRRFGETYRRRLLVTANVVRFEVFTAVTMKNGVFWVVMPCGSCKNRLSEEPGASFIRVTKIGELRTTQAATSNRRTLRRNTK
jgi:LSD1 subclass zinc finger protein